MKLIFGTVSLAAVLLLSGCSHKEVYKPDNVKGEWRTAGRLSASIAQTGQSAAMLDNGHLLTSDGETAPISLGSLMGQSYLTLR